MKGIRSDNVRGNPRGAVSVDVKLDKYEKLIKSSKLQNITIKQFLDNIIKDKYEHDDFLKLIAPRLSIIEFSEISIIVKDEILTKMRFAAVRINNNELYCDLDDERDCKHIRFCLSSNKLKNLKNLKSL